MGTRNNIDLKNRKTELEEAIENNEPKKLVKLLNIFTKKFKTFQKHISEIPAKDLNLQKINIVKDNAIVDPLCCLQTNKNKNIENINSK